MTCKNYIKIGATLSIDIERVEGEAPVSLSGSSIESYLRHPKYGTYELNLEEIDLDNGQIRLYMDADDTAIMAEGDYIWDIKFVDPDGNTEIFPKDNQVVLTFIKGATP